MPTKAVRDVWRRLEEGNKNYAHDLNGGASRYTSPDTIVFTCMDPRVFPNSVFNRKQGRLVVLRNAGNCVDKGIIADISFALDHFRDVPIVVVLGHTDCGAVKAAIKAVREGTEERHSSRVTDRIGPLVKEAISKGVAEEDLVDEVTFLNVAAGVKALRESEVAESVVAVIGAIYNLETGIVKWLDC